MKKVFFLLYEIFIFLPILIIVTIITAVVVMIGVTIGNKDFWSYYPPKYWSKIVCYVSLCRVNVINKANLDPDKSYVFVPNHQGMFDVFLIYGFLGKNIKWVQKKELRKIPFVGIASEMAGHVFVDQSNLRNMKETITKVEEQITEGISMVIFPEGARTQTGKMGRFKRGAFIIAKEMNLSVVPITLNGPFDVMKIHTYLINPGKLELVIHEPISMKDVSEDDQPEMIEGVKSIIYNDLWARYK